MNKSGELDANMKECIWRLERRRGEEKEKWKNGKIYFR
jgi:hypothetical protein